MAGGVRFEKAQEWKARLERFEKHLVSNGGVQEDMSVQLAVGAGLDRPDPADTLPNSLDG